MDDLQDLYQELILDHNRHPRNRRPLPEASHHAYGYNPLCGDRVRINLLIDGDVVRQATFEGNGCAISTASASLLTEALTGKTVSQARRVSQAFHAMLIGGAAERSDVDLGKLRVFTGVCRYPARVKCATLACHTFNAALENKKDMVTTE
jgi:nitrogen fixation NifU-like protein